MSLFFCALLGACALAIWLWMFAFAGSFPSSAACNPVVSAIACACATPKTAAIVALVVTGVPDGSETTATRSDPATDPAAGNAVILGTPLHFDVGQRAVHAHRRRQLQI